MFRSLSARILLGHLAVAWLGLLALWLASSQLFARYYIGSREQELRRIAGDLAVVARPALVRGDNDQAQQVARTASRLLDARVCVFPLGQQQPVAACAEGSPRLDACPTEAESAARLPGRREVLVTRSRTACEPTVTLVADAPVLPLGGSTPIGSILVRMPVRGMDDVLATQRRLSLGAAGLVAVLATVFGLVSARAISRPLRSMSAAAQQLAAGDFAVDLPVSSPAEAGALAQTMNTMAASLRRAFAAVNEERDRLSAIISSMTEGVVALDRDGRVVLANARAAGLLGLRSDPAGSAVTAAAGTQWKQAAEQQARASAAKDAAPRADAPEAQAPPHTAGAGERSAPGAQCRERIGDRLLQFRIAPLPGPEGGAVVVAEDVTEADRMEQARREFVANASHQLRAPLTSVRGYLEALTDGVAEAPEARGRCVQVALEQTRHMQQIVDELLELSRLEAGDIRLEQEPVDLGGLAAGAATALKPQADARSIRLTVTSPDEAELSVLADGDRLLGALLNLLDNAIRHSPAGGTVTVSLTPGGDGVRVAVADEGPGLPAGQWDWAWERFRQGPGASRAHGGAGLGLAVCREVVQLHGGRVFAGPRPEGGSEFGFVLPGGSAATGAG